jgi:hypothetical protein
METRISLLKYNQCAHELEIRADLILYLLDDFFGSAVGPLLGLSSVVGLFFELLVYEGVNLILDFFLYLTE